MKEMLEKEGRGFVEDTFEVGYDNWSACKFTPNRATENIWIADRQRKS